MAPKTILLTGGTDGIGLQTARMLASAGHTVLLHGRSQAKLDAAAAQMPGLSGRVETLRADLSRLAEVEALAREVRDRHAGGGLDVLINNAGVLKTPEPVTADGLDARFAVNTIAPYLLSSLLLPHFTGRGRIVNVSSAAQAPVDLDALAGRTMLGSDMAAYSQSKLALNMCTRHLAARMAPGQVAVAVNPGSLLASKMVREGFGVPGKDVDIGARILVRAALEDDFDSAATGRYWDNDAGRFADPHSDALDPAKVATVVRVIDDCLARLTPSQRA